MKQIILLAFISVLIGCSPKKPNLDGDYVPIRQEMAGMLIPDSNFAKQKLSISDSNYTVTAESMDKGVIRFADGKMDIYGRDGVNAGKHFMAIYKVEDDILSICYNLKGDAYPSSYETKGQEMCFLCAFKKEKK